MGRTYESMMEELEVIEILSTAYDGDEFPGYENIRLSFSQLETIIRNKRSGWLDALRNQKAVYLITDTSNGKMYVGSATAQYGMLLQRWTNYIDNGHGGNIELKHLVDTKGFDYPSLGDRRFPGSPLQGEAGRGHGSACPEHQGAWDHHPCHTPTEGRWSVRDRIRASQKEGL